MSARLVLIALLTVGVLATGCADDGKDSEAPPRDDDGTSIGVLAPPGLYEQDDGTWQALGLLTYRDLEGGFWAVVDTVQPERADTAAIVAVIVPDAAISAEMEPLRGKYVSAIGTKRDGADIYQAGPVIDATSIEEVVEMTVED